MPDNRPQLIAERYRLVSQIGQGGMGRVWKARDELLARDVAVKEILPPAGTPESELAKLRERAIREARAIAMLDQSNVVRIFDVIFHQANPWIVMELVPSRSLFDVVNEDGPMPPDRVARIGLEVLAALRAAHQAGLLHRDVKPGNVLLAHDGRVVLTDFGLAVATGDAGITHTGVILGSPQYLAPERALDGEIGPAADLWSLGATLYAAVEGRPPYVRSTPIATLAALATESPTAPERAGELRYALAALLQRDPAQRADAETAQRLLLAVATPAASTAPVGAEPVLATPMPVTTYPHAVLPTTAGSIPFPDNPTTPNGVPVAQTTIPSPSQAGATVGKPARRRRVTTPAGVAVAVLVAGGMVAYPLMGGAPESVQPQAAAMASPDGAAEGSVAPAPSRSRRDTPTRSPGAVTPSARQPSADAPVKGSAQASASPKVTAPTAAATTKPADSGATAVTGSRIQSMGTGTCLYAPTATGTVQLWACNDSAGQRFARPSDSTLRVRGKCVQIDSTQNGATLQLATCTGAPAQQWDLNSSFDLVSLWAVKCVDVPEASSANGVVAQVWECTGAAHQKWS